MNIFGVSPVEIVLIAVLGLIIFGPERLPEIGRYAGRMVARVLAWQYTSPEAQLLNELRRDFEKQIYEIRDEMVRASQQLDVRPELQELQRETEALLRGEHLETPAAKPKLDQMFVEPTPSIAPPAPAPEPPTVSPKANEQQLLEDLILSNSPEPVASNGIEPVHNATALPNAEIELLSLQIQALMADMQSLQEQLRQHGMIAHDWQPPSQMVPQEEPVTTAPPQTEEDTSSQVMQQEESILVSTDKA